MGTSLIELIENIKKDFKNSSMYLENYLGNDYQKYIIVDELTYNRKRIYIDDKIEILVITWDKNHEAKIHNHSENGCFLKVLEGSLEEIVFSPNLNLQKKRILEKGNISYMDNKIGLHSVKNIFDEICVSIHIYSPPNHSTTFYE
jgi:cysteine dioxygenase